MCQVHFFKRVRLSLTVLLATLMLTSCGGGGSDNGQLEPANSVPTASNVSIADDNDGSIVVGVNLTGSYTFADAEGDDEGTSAYQWLRDGSVIDGATTISYTLESSDSGQLITFEITPVAATGTRTGNSASSSGVLVENSAPAALDVGISGDNDDEFFVGDSLIGNYTFEDLDDDLEGASTYRWLRSGEVINGAVARSYTLVAEDSDKFITFEVTPVAETGLAMGEVVTFSQRVSNQAPLVSEVSITDDNGGGNAVEGDSLTGSYTFTDADGDLEGISTFQWLRNDVVIEGATGISYVMVAEDIPTQISFRVTPVAATGASVGDAVNSAPLATGTSPRMSGFVRYLDINHNGINDANDQLIIPFDQSIIVNSNDPTSFNLIPNINSDNTFGEDASVASGPANNEVTITLGTAPYFKTRQDFSGIRVANGSSGVQVSPSMQADAIEGLSGLDIASTSLDIIPAYVDGLQSLGANDSSSIALGDVDGDGDLDMVVANHGSQGNQVYSNNGNGVFFDTEQSLGVNDSLSVALGDVDGDGDLDMVVANLKGNRVYVNDGSGNFNSTSQSLGENRSQSVVLGDVDSDGDLDMVVANSNLTGDRIYRNNGNGIFTDTDQSFVSSDDLVLGDVDGDGDLDMVVVSSIEGNRVYNNDGAGIFTDSSQSLGSNDSRSVVLGDVDGDGDLDIVVANLNDQIRIYSNNGAGIFIESEPLNIDSSINVVLEDVDDDGDLDILAVNSNAGNQIYSNDGSGVFTNTGQLLGNSSSYSSAVGDVDGDGDLDMVVANSGIQGNRVYFNSLSGTWGSVEYVDSDQSLGLESLARSIALGDLDGDGDLDMANAGNNRIYRNEGNGIFTDMGQLLGTSNSYFTALGDLDGDGDLDIVLANNFDSGNKVYANDGVGNFTDTGQLLGDNDSVSIALGDVDGDGDLDIVTGNHNVNQGNRIYLNNGTGVFTDTGQSLGVTDKTTSVTLGDVDGDGDLDMVVANNDGQANRVYSNNGSGLFADNGQSLGDHSSLSVILGDIDGDGDLDIVVANELADSRIYANNGSGIFTNSAQLLSAGFVSYSTALGDVDGDGDLDVVVANYGGGNQVFYNDGIGISFSDSGQSLGTNDSVSIVLGDVDGDGDLDIATANYSTEQGNVIYLSQ